MQQSFASVSKSADAGGTSPAVIELDSLLRDYLLGLVLIGGIGRDTGTRPVQWVHSSDLLDPAPFLTPRTVLLTTGAQFGDDDPEVLEAYVQRLIHAGATALGVGAGLRWERIPPALIELCDRLHLPLFRVPYDTPFLAVVRTAARLIDARAAADWGREQHPPPSFSGRRERLLAAERSLREAVLQLMVDGRLDLAERVAAKALPQLPRGSLSVLTFSEPPDERFPTDFAALVTEQPGVLSATLDGATVVIAEAGEVARLRRALTRAGVPAGVSERATAADLPELLEQARRASELARGARDPGPLDYRPEMHAGVLQLLRDSPEAVRRAQGLLAPLRRHDERHEDRLEHSLAVWLRHHGQTSPAAAELGVHRHTLRSRVQAAESLLQRDLDDPDLRAELWAALRLAE
ncbi:PucR family transcriptional regulator [Leucobacter weissii]|uniref:PucR family transcriptional regulator n=1 Tax=Leucobacter weissii TaxID=1983706 RepID=A0A939MHZ5_9MICO|nr:PucR family transcriptional regulator [Leucobacter weissii]MBO1901088.1 PucR family transcriptional regulator [Leucobacter weissii]